MTDKEVIEALKRIENVLQEINIRLSKIEKVNKKSQLNVTPYESYDKPSLITKKKFKWW